MILGSTLHDSYVSPETRVQEAAQETPKAAPQAPQDSPQVQHHKAEAVPVANSAAAPAAAPSPSEAAPEVESKADRAVQLRKVRMQNANIHSICSIDFSPDCFDA